MDIPASSGHKRIRPETDFGESGVRRSPETAMASQATYSSAVRKPYLIVNLVLAGLIGLVFLYSAVFSAEKNNHPLPSFHEKITGQPAPSSGISRAFSAIMRGDREAAREYNPDALLIFAFFLIQGVQRLAVCVLLAKCRINARHLLVADVVLSAGMFLFAFRGQIEAFFRLFTGD